MHCLINITFLIYEHTAYWWQTFVSSKTHSHWKCSCIYHWFLSLGNNVDDKKSCQNKKCINLRDNERSKNNDRLMKKLYFGATLLLKEHISVMWVSIHRKSLYIEMGLMAFAFWECGIHIAHRYIWLQFPISMQLNSVKKSPVFDKSLVFLL